MPGVLDAEPELTDLVIEGGGDLARPWTDEAQARGIGVRHITAEHWRSRFLYPREQRSGETAKARADGLARQVIDWSGAKKPTSLRHDAAEAILVGLWGVLELGWLAAMPPALNRISL